MNRLLTAFFLIYIMVLSACQKAEQSAETGRVSLALKAANSPAAFATPWQTVGTWQKDGAGYHARQPLPSGTKGGKVLLFAKNVWAADAPMEAPMDDVPLQLPFNFLPFNDQPGLVETWNYEVLDNELKIDLAVEGGTLQPRPVQMRCLYIPDSVWNELKDAGDEALAYGPLVTRLQLQP